jgi:hypothetical protein
LSELTTEPSASFDFFRFGAVGLVTRQGVCGFFVAVAID